MNRNSIPLSDIFLPLISDRTFQYNIPYPCMKTEVSDGEGLPYPKGLPLVKLLLEQTGSPTFTYDSRILSQPSAKFFVNFNLSGLTAS